MVKTATRLFTVDEYYRMAEAGILHEDDRVELIEGVIVEMAAIGSRHAAVVDRLTGLFARGTRPEQAIVRVQNPVRLDNRSEPEPDVILLRIRDDFYEASHPGPADVLLLVEVMDSSEDFDKQVKLPIYAGAGIAEVWLVNLNARHVEVYAEPSANLYKAMKIATQGDTLTPRALPDVTIGVADVLGGPPSP